MAADVAFSKMHATLTETSEYQTRDVKRELDNQLPLVEGTLSVRAE